MPTCSCSRGLGRGSPHRCLSQVAVIQQVQGQGGVRQQPPEQPGGVAVPLEAQLPLDLPPGAGRYLPLLGAGWNYIADTSWHLLWICQDRLLKKNQEEAYF